MILAYEWQLHSYKWLTGAKKALLVYGLADTSEELIQDEIRKQMYYKGIIDYTSTDAEAIEKQIRLNMTFSDRIPAKNRLKTFAIDRAEKKIDQIKMRVEMSWKKLEELHKLETEHVPEILKNEVHP
jgi:alcohol dehydrogenase YqhD (iron-dependent ADH family)